MSKIINFLKRNLFIIVVLLITIPSFYALLRPGFFPMQDDMQVFRLKEMDICIKDGQIPCRWIPDAGYGYGYPQYNYYSPFVYYLGEVFHLAGFQFIDSIKIVIILGFLLGALFIYILAKALFGQWGGLIASVFYTYAPFKAQEIYVRGALSEFWISVFYPLVLWAIYKLIKEGSRKYFFWTSVSIAGMFLAHNLLSILFIPVIVFWIIYWVIAEKKIRIWKTLTLSLALGFAMSSFFTLPLYFEKGYVHIETLLGGYFGYMQHFVTLKELFLSSHWGYGSSVLGPIDDLSLSTGIPHWIVGIIALVLALFNLKKNRKISLLILGLGAIELVVLFLMHERSSFVWSVVKPLAYLQFPWRFLSISVVILSMFAAFVVQGLGKLKYILAILGLGAVLLLYGGFFRPQTWLNISDQEKLSGEHWEKELTASIFDYLPIYAQFPPESKAPDLPEILNGSALFKNYYKGSNYQTGELSVERDARIRLPLFDFPGMTVYLNDKKIEHTHDDCSGEKFCHGLITFDAEKGKYSFKVKLENTPVRNIGNWLSILGAAGLLVLVFKRNDKIFQK